MPAMTDKAIWSKRVSEWRASGESSAAFCKGKGFTAGGLRYWAHRLDEEQRSEPSPPSVRLARVLRASAPAERAMVERARRTTSPASAPASDGAVVIEVGEARVSVGPGFDRTTLASVLDVLGEKAGAR